MVVLCACVCTHSHVCVCVLNVCVCVCVFSVCVCVFCAWGICLVLLFCFSVSQLLVSCLKMYSERWVIKENYKPCVLTYTYTHAACGPCSEIHAWQIVLGSGVLMLLLVLASLNKNSKNALLHCRILWTKTREAMCVCVWL